jgi:putative oxidoreductase
MNDTLRNPLALVGRVLLALMFVLAGAGKVGGFAGTVAYMQSAGLPATQALALLVILLEIGAGLALMLGYRTRPAALALAAFTLLASFIFHAFWSAPPAQAMVQNLLFMKNLSVAGGLLLLAALGPGAWSLDARRQGALRGPGRAAVHGA